MHNNMHEGDGHSLHTEMSLFVYGSFSEGMVHYDKIRQYIVSREPAYVRGAAYRLQVGYPVYTSAGDDLVPGELVKLKAPDLFFRILDEFHGFSPLFPDKSLFLKEQKEVQTTRGETLMASVYAMNPAKLTKTASRIINGDWRESVRSQPVLPATLTERQSSYVKKLSQTTGREIVPIDLILYRELLKLDLIVDKGRRLALTKLGKEVARYLA